MTVLDAATTERALRALRCSAISPAALQTMAQTSVPLQDFVGVQGVRLGYTKRTLSQLSAEDDLLWLISVGVMRREVDGQGITDRFRLTPLGMTLIKSRIPATTTPLEQGLDWLLRRLPY